jgi:hypothetical protein
MMTEGGASPEERVSYGYRLLLARTPDAPRRRALVKALDGFAAGFRADGGAASEFLRQGESAARPGLDERELAAYASVANLILNLDETITKE